MRLHEMSSLTFESLPCLGILTAPMIPYPRADISLASSGSMVWGDLKRRNLKKFRLEREKQVYLFKPEFFHVSSFQLLKLKHLHCDGLHIILSLSTVQIYNHVKRVMRLTTLDCGLRNLMF